MSKVWDYKSDEDDKLAVKVAKDAGIVFTKPAMVKHLISLVDFPAGATVLDPCAGDMVFFDHFPEHCKKDWCEINKGKDFFDYNQKADYIISNPPFVPRKLFWTFHRKAMELAQVEIWWLLNMSSLNVFTPKRLEEMKEKSWFITQLNITADKRWFGRYTFIKFGKIDRGFVKYDKITF